jgi:hypothetical protein
MFMDRKFVGIRDVAVLMLDWDSWRALVNAGMILWVSKKCGEFLE